MDDDLRDRIHQDWLRASHAREDWDAAYERTEAIVRALPDGLVACEVVASDDRTGDDAWDRRVVGHDDRAIYILTAIGVAAESIAATARRFPLGDIIEVVVTDRGERRHTGHLVPARTWTFRTPGYELVLETSKPPSRGAESLARSMASACGWTLPPPDG